MLATDGFVLSPPAEEDLATAENAWRDGRIRCELSAGSRFWRVIRASPSADPLQYARTCYPPDAMNRFTPVFNSGIIVPAAYAGSTRQIALWEVVLRGIRHDGIRRVPAHQIRDRYLIETHTIRPLALLDLRRPAVANVVAPAKRPPDLTAAWPSGYATTRAWAQQLYDRVPEIDGFLYESHHVPGDCILLLQPDVPEVFATFDDAQLVCANPVRSILTREARDAGAIVDFGDVVDPEDSRA